MMTTKLKNRMIYAGPTLSRGRLLHATVFIGAYTAPVRKLMEEHPWFEQLFVPVMDYQKAMDEIHKDGTVRHIFYKRAESEV